MATDINGFAQFSDGTFTSLRLEGATAEAVTAVPTGGTGLSQTAGIDIGQAYPGKMLVAIALQVQTDNDITGAFCHGYLMDPLGKIVCGIQGGGYSSQGLPKLDRPVKMEVGMKVFATFDASADSATQLGSYVVYCTDGTADVFTAKGVDGVKTSMINKNSSTIGQALAGKSIAKAYATYPSTNGLNDNGDGNGGFYIEAADGQLKMMHSPAVVVGSNDLVEYVTYAVPVKIDQNDTLSIMTGA